MKSNLQPGQQRTREKSSSFSQIVENHLDVFHGTPSSEVHKRAKREEKGLSEFVRIVLGVPLNKSEQMSDWEKRPLRQTQILYAGSL